MCMLSNAAMAQCVDIYDTLRTSTCNSYSWQGLTYTASGTYTARRAGAVAGGCDSLLALVLRVSHCNAPTSPDNIDTSRCAHVLEQREWSISHAWSAGGASNHNTPLVGDLDDDGTPEIVCFGSQGEYDNNGLLDNRVLVYDGATKRQKANFAMPVYVTAYDAGAYGLVKLPNRKGLIVVAGIDMRLRAFDITSANPSVPYWVSNTTYGSGGQYAVNVSFADIDNNGSPEVMVRNHIFDAATGTLLATATGGRNTGASYAHYSHRTGRTLFSPMVADIIGDNTQEVILGNEIYNADIVNYSGTSGNHLTLARRIEPPAGVVDDGHAQVADFNLDGHLDVLITNKDIVGSGGTVSMYVWDVHNNSVSPAVRIACNMSGKSMPLIADIDNDQQLEVIIQCAAAGVGSNRVRTYKYNTATGQFQLMWGFPVDEDSYSNGMTAFDFNLDGVNEMLICDQSRIRVVNGQGQTMNTFPFSETTIMQYPVIADVDNDGHAEIVSVGSGMLNVFKSSGQPWAPARAVWNQYMYNITNINNDLTTPRYYFDNATAYTDPDDGTIRRPYNNFLQQTTSIDHYARPFYGLPDAAVAATNVSFADHAFHVSANYCNQGSAPLSSPYSISVYARTHGGHDSLIATQSVEHALTRDSCTTFNYDIPIDDACHLPFDGVTVVINDGGNGAGIEHTECDIANNSGFVLFPLSRARYVEIDKKQCDSFYWDEVDSTYYTSGVYSYTVSAFDGCDSTRTLHLTVPYRFDDTTTTTVCDAYTWPIDRQTYTATTKMNHRFKTRQGCDSVWNLDLTVHYSYTFRPHDSITDDQLPHHYGGRTYNNEVRNDPFYFTTTDGCDSNYYYTLHIDYHTLLCSGFLQYPNLVTPNGDGINDRFVIVNLIEEQCYPNNELCIYNRWGHLVYHMYNITTKAQFWDPAGMPIGTYYYNFRGHGTHNHTEHNGMIEIYY